MALLRNSIIAQIGIQYENIKTRLYDDLGKLLSLLKKSGFENPLPVVRENLNTKHTGEVLKTVMRVVRGWINYHNVSDNGPKVEAFRKHCMRIIFKWINRKGGRHSMSWERFNQILKAIGFPKAGKLYRCSGRAEHVWGH